MHKDVYQQYYQDESEEDQTPTQHINKIISDIAYNSLQDYSKIEDYDEWQKYLSQSKLLKCFKIKLY